MSEDPGTVDIHVREIEDCCRDVKPAHLLPIEDDYDHQKHKGGRENAVSAAEVEVSQTDCGGALKFGEQDIRDEIAGQHEENNYSKLAVATEHFTGNMSPFDQVAQYDEGDRDRSKSV